MSKNEQKELKSIISDVPKKGVSPIIHIDMVAKAIETILSNPNDQIAPSFYHSINPAEEFGVSRFVLDRVIHLPDLLKKTELIYIPEASTYLVTAEKRDSCGNSIKLEHRFKASNHEEAKELCNKILSQLAEIQNKIWLACWKLGDELHRFSFTCKLTDLMKLTYPERESPFSVSEKIEFFEHLKSLEQTKILFSKPEKQKKNGKKILRQTFEIPLLQIFGRIGGEEDRYPIELSLSIMNLEPYPGKMAFVGAAFKHKTLELHAGDIRLATWLQTRKSQRQDEEFIQVELSYLFNLAGLEKTAESNKTHAKKLLLNKLQRYADKGILPSAPQKLDDMVVLKIR